MIFPLPLFLKKRQVILRNHTWLMSSDTYPYFLSLPPAFLVSLSVWLTVYYPWSHFAQICISKFDVSFIKVTVIARLIYSIDIWLECMHLSLQLLNNHSFTTELNSANREIQHVCIHVHKHTRVICFLYMEKCLHLQKSAAVLGKQFYIELSVGNSSFAQQYVNIPVSTMFTFIFQ